MQDNALGSRLRYPGISVPAGEIETLAESLRKRYAVFRFKEYLPVPWVVFIGGTGTGKSTIFNALCGETISRTGVERPQTDGPVLYLHRDVPLQEHFPFPEPLIDHQEEVSAVAPGTAGSAGSYTVIRHERPELAHLILVDAPDLDSIDRRHRDMVEDLCLMADRILFVASQEKYADDVPSAFLRRIIEEGTPCLFILNKATDSLRTDDVLSLYSRQGIALGEGNVFTIPYVQGGTLTVPRESEPLRNLRDLFFRGITAGNTDMLLRDGRERSARVLGEETGRLLQLLSGEAKAGREWQKRLDTLFQEKGRELLAAMADHYRKGNLRAIQKEVRKVFSRYDILAKPRRYVAGLISLPLRLAGLRPKVRDDARKKELADAGRRVDFTPILFGIDDINRTVLERFSPTDVSAPLSQALRTPGVILSADEIRDRLESLQDGLATWTEDMFRDLMKGIPKHKELGIYSTSILWGMVIVSFEIVLGGGFGLLEAVLDSFIAPFVTKGSSELFAYNELRQIARELDARNREGLLSILDEQKGRYHECLASVTTTEETFELLRRPGTAEETPP